jgi:Holliday junction resolvase RusA-like endonuclease
VFRFFFLDYYTKTGERRRTLPDLSNLYEMPQDCLQTAGIIDNDTDIISHDGSRRLPGVENRLEILIYEVDEWM